MSFAKNAFKCFVLSFGIVRILAAAERPPLEEGIRLFETHKFAEARELLEPYAKEDRGGDVAYYLGRISMREQDFEKAVASLERAVQFQPESSEYHHWLGRAYGQKAIRASLLKQPFLAKKVKAHFERAVTLDPSNLDARFDLEEFYLVAPGIMGGSAEKATEQAREIRKRDTLRGYRAYGRIYEQQKELERAQQEYARALREYPQKADPYYWMSFHYQRRKDYSKAFELLEKLLKEDPSQVGAYYAIARTALVSGERLDRAEECLELYLQKEPGKDDPPLSWAHYRLGMVYEKKGDRDAAKKEYAAALRLNPSHKDAREALKKIS